MKWDSFLHFMTYFDISIILSSHNFCEASWVGWQLSGPTCGHTLDTAVSTVTTEQQCLVPGTMCRQYTELFICPAPHQKQPGEIMTINISLGGAHWWLVVWLLYVVVIFPIFAAPPMVTMASVWRVGLIPSAGGSLALDNLEISLLISWGCKNCVDTLYTTTHR